MRKRILFHYPIFNVGGAEMSVLRLTRLLALNGWDVELVLTTGGGGLEGQIDPRVKISRLRDRSAGDRFLAARTFVDRLRNSDDLCRYLCYRVQGWLRSLPYFFRCYDAAIISLHGLSPAFCCRMVRANKRLHWIRNDLSQCDASGKVARNLSKFHHQIDHYICVSQTAYASLVTLYPGVRDKALVLYNVIDARGMRERAEGVANPYSRFGTELKVVTVCRLLDRAKGLYRMLDVHKRLHDEGIRFYWYVVGDGPDRQNLEKRIEQAGLEGRFILIGRQENPFPYYKYADIAATLSYYEGLCGTVNEAKVMGRPVIATEFSGIREQLTDGVNGLIVGNDEQSIYEGMKRLLCDSNLRARLTNDFLPQAILDDDYKIEQLSLLLTPNQEIA